MFMHKVQQKRKKIIQGGINFDVLSKYEWFALNTASGLTQAGLARVNQAIEAFVYYILGALVLMEDAMLARMIKNT